MANITVAPAQLDIIAVAGDPFALLLTVAVTDDNGDPVLWSSVTSPLVEMRDYFSNPNGGTGPVVTSPASGQWLLSWTAIQTSLLGTQRNGSWTLSATIGGIGPLALVAGSISMRPDSVSSSSSSSSADLIVQVGTNKVALSVTTGGGASSLGGNGFVAFGDSISESGFNASVGGFGGNWPILVSVLSQQQLNNRDVGWIGGVGGNTSTQMLTRIASIIALKPQVVSVLAGTNDLNGSVPFATWSGNIKAIAGQLRAAGIRVVLCTIPPRGNTTFLATQLQWNAWLRAYAQANGYDLVDFFTVLVDPTTGMYKTGYDSGDATHPSQVANAAMAAAFISQVKVPAFSPLQALLVTDGNNMLSNPLLTAGSPTPTGWIPFGTGGGTVPSGCTEGLVTDSDFGGKAWQQAFDGTQVGVITRSLFSPVVSTGFSVGDSLLMCWRSKVVSSAVTPAVDVGIRAQVNFTGGTPAGILMNRAEATTRAVGLSWYEFTVAPGTTSLQLEFDMLIIPPLSAITARWGNFGLYNLTAMGLLAP